MKRTRKNPGICRIDQPDRFNHGFYVRINRDRRKVRKFFSDRANGGKRAALRAAKAYYAEIDRKYPRISRRKNAMIQRRVGVSGILGVCKITKTLLGRNYLFWMASWSPRPGVVAKKAFSIRKYGNDRARALAIKARRQGLRQMED
ncbi:MAG: hypothetical protein LBH01_02045 [Verrucomicrobiales bacterium]|jgi:hypothetical protein|nr:hypothetical protein [Verrucomicrobiales bacterium]